MIVHRLEWERATGVGGRVRGYLPQRWPERLEPNLVDFDGDAVGPFRASYDVVGDGRLLLVPTPGHTAGHASLLVRDEQRSWLLAGDLAHTASGGRRASRPEMARWCRAAVGRNSDCSRSGRARPTGVITSPYAADPQRLRRKDF